MKESNMKQNKIELIVGDWSNDGHGRTRMFTIASNLTKAELEKAYEAGVKIVGFDPKHFVEDYQQSYLPAEQILRLIELGIKDWVAPDDDDDEDVEIYPDAYKDIWLFVAKLGNPEFEFELNVPSETIKVGGYGLFY
jgi:hypothetical protein